MKNPSFNNIVVRWPEIHILEAPDSVLFAEAGCLTCLFIFLIPQDQYLCNICKHLTTNFKLFLKYIYQSIQHENSGVL